MANQTNVNFRKYSRLVRENRDVVPTPNPSQTLKTQLLQLKNSKFRDRRTLKTAARNFRVSSSVMEPSPFSSLVLPYISNTARVFAFSCTPQNVLIPLLLPRRAKAGVDQGQSCLSVLRRSLQALLKAQQKSNGMTSTKPFARKPHAIRNITSPSQVLQWHRAELVFVQSIKHLSQSFLLTSSSEACMIRARQQH